VRDILKETRLEPRYIEFELTETAFMQNAESTVAVLRELKDMGIHLILDDFGTGHSSLSFLKRVPIDSLKIDKSLVHGLCTDSDDSKLVSAVINLGRSFHLQVIAEGVETRNQFPRLSIAQRDRVTIFRNRLKLANLPSCWAPTCRQL
jgi:EAL domain-containing protein (putative c-di-GMP-specific phosphodiesterase class I)